MDKIGLRKIYIYLVFGSNHPPRQTGLPSGMALVDKLVAEDSRRSVKGGEKIACCAGVTVPGESPVFEVLLYPKKRP